MDEWMERLRERVGEVRATSDARRLVSDELRRRRRQRQGLAAFGAVAAVAVVVGAAAVVTQLAGEDPSDPAQPTLGNSSSATVAPDPTGFTCPGDSAVHTEDAPLPDQATVTAHKRTYAEVVAGEFDGFEIYQVEVFNAGVYALVTGDVWKAERELGALGVSGVRLWDPSGPEVGLDAHAQLEMLIQWRLEPILRHARRETRGIPGLAGFAYWRDADAILVQWKEPVPAEVRVLEDVRFKTGGHIIVRGVTYSAADVRRAQHALQDWLRESDRRRFWSYSSACGDFSGLEVGMTPAYLEDTDVPALQREIAHALGMPARVVPEEKPVGLLPVPPED